MSNTVTIEINPLNISKILLNHRLSFTDLKTRQTIDIDSPSVFNDLYNKYGSLLMNVSLEEASRNNYPITNNDPNNLNVTYGDTYIEGPKSLTASLLVKDYLDPEIDSRYYASNSDDARSIDDIIKDYRDLYGCSLQEACQLFAAKANWNYHKDMFYRYNWKDGKSIKTTYGDKLWEQMQQDLRQIADVDSGYLDLAADPQNAIKTSMKLYDDAVKKSLETGKDEGLPKDYLVINKKMPGRYGDLFKYTPAVIDTYGTSLDELDLASIAENQSTFGLLFDDPRKVIAVKDLDYHDPADNDLNNGLFALLSLGAGVSNMGIKNVGNAAYRLGQKGTEYFVRYTAPSTYIRPLATNLFRASPGAANIAGLWGDNLMFSTLSGLALDNFVRNPNLENGAYAALGVLPYGSMVLKEPLYKIGTGVTRYGKNFYLNFMKDLNYYRNGKFNYLSSADDNYYTKLIQNQASGYNEVTNVPNKLMLKEFWVLLPDGTYKFSLEALGKNITYDKQGRVSKKVLLLIANSTSNNSRSLPKHVKEILALTLNDPEFANTNKIHPQLLLKVMGKYIPLILESAIQPEELYNLAHYGLNRLGYSGLLQYTNNNTEFNTATFSTRGPIEAHTVVLDDGNHLYNYGLYPNRKLGLNYFMGANGDTAEALSRQNRYMNWFASRHFPGQNTAHYRYYYVPGEDNVMYISEIQSDFGEHADIGRRLIDSDINNVLNAPLATHIEEIPRDLLDVNRQVSDFIFNNNMSNLTNSELEGIYNSASNGGYYLSNDFGYHTIYRPNSNGRIVPSRFLDKNYKLNLNNIVDLSLTDERNLILYFKDTTPINSAVVKLVLDYPRHVILNIVDKAISEGRYTVRIPTASTASKILGYTLNTLNKNKPILDIYDNLLQVFDNIYGVGTFKLKPVLDINGNTFNEIQIPRNFRWPKLFKYGGKNK